MRRKDKERDAAFAWQVMAEAPYATLSLVDGEGRPYAVPVSQAAWPEGECIYFHCAIGGKKYEIFENGCEAVMSAVSRTEIVLGQYTVAYASAIARGRLEIIADPEERMHAMAVLCRQFDPAAGELYAAYGRKDLPGAPGCGGDHRKREHGRRVNRKKMCFPGGRHIFFLLVTISYW